MRAWLLTLCAMLLATLAGLAAAQEKGSVVDEWEYVFFDSAKPAGVGRAILLRMEDGKHRLRIAGTGSVQPHVCLRRDAKLRIDRSERHLTLTPVVDLPTCPQYRLVLRRDGSGGVRETQEKDGTWKPDGLQRSLRRLARLDVQARAGAAAPPEAPAPRLRARALVIGNGAYASFGALPNPRNDAQAIAGLLRSLKIDTELVLDADRDAFAKALSDFAGRSASDDVNIVYYAGHGVQVDGVNYLVPTNFRAEGVSAAAIKLNTISLNTLLDALPARTRIVFLDACRDNPLSRSLLAVRGGGSGLAPVSVTTSGTLIAYATRDGATAEDGKGKHSPYAAALLEHLGRPQDIAVVLRHVRESVMKATANRQEPWEYGSLVGDQLVLARLAR
jgi:hypothetical protein